MRSDTIPFEDFDHLKKIANELLSLGYKKIAFSGTLGPGKTTFIKFLLEGLGVHSFDGSPTYSIIHNYSSNYPIYHIDAYRIETTKEGFHLGLDELLEEEAYFFIEWPEKISAFLPDDIIWVYIRINQDSNSRTIEIRT